MAQPLGPDHRFGWLITIEALRVEMNEYWINAEERLPSTDGEEVEFRTKGKIRRGRFFLAVPYPFEDHDPKGDAYPIDEVDGWRSIPALVARVRELEAELQSIAEWEIIRIAKDALK